MKHAAIYLRVSSRSQDVASQEEDLKCWAAAQAEPVRWYKDKFTGRTMTRPGFSRLEDRVHCACRGACAQDDLRSSESGVKVRDLIKLIENDGWYQVRTRGDHRQ